MDNLTVVIPYYRGQATIQRLLDSLPPGLPVIIVDDGYPEGDEPPRLKPQEENTRVTVIHLSAKGYFAGAVNAGIDACATDVLVLNQDTWLEGDAWLDLLAQHRGRYAMIGERIRGEHPAFPNGYIHGTFMYLRRDAIDAIGLLNLRDYPLWGCTAEWQWRAARRGFAILPLPEIPGFRHERPADEAYGTSIQHLLAKDAKRRDWFIRTPPLVSVIVPCHNYGRYLTDCIHSLIGGPTSFGDMPGQTLQSFEVIIVDDASTDETPEVGPGLADPWKGIRYVRLDENVGTARALNYGIERAVGKYITFLSADDLREPTSLDSLVRACEANPHSFAYDDVWLAGGGKRIKQWPMPDYDFETLLYKNQIHAGILYPKRAWIEVGGYPPAMNDGREDWAFNVALGIHGWCGVHVRQFGYLYRREGQNRSLHNTSPEHREYFLNKIARTFPAVYGGHRPMGCCGKGGAGKGTQTLLAASNGGAKRAKLSIPGSEGMVRLEYLGSQMLATWSGPATNIPYRFGKDRSVAWVDSRDVGERGKSGFLNMKKDGRWLFQVYVEPAPEAEPVTFPDPQEPAPTGEPAADELTPEAVEEAEPLPSPAVEFPDPATLTVDQVRALELTPAQWQALLEAEKAGKARKGVIEHAEGNLASAG